MINKSNRYQELDALRGIAAMMVVLFHFTMFRKETELGFRLGITGVDLFFIISGFVIFMSLTKVKTSRDFIINRVSRLYPTYWICVSFTFLLISIVKLNSGSDIPFLQYIGNMTMFQHYLGIPDLNGPYWTMIIEMNFYISILLLFHFKGIKYLTFFGTTLCVLSVIVTLLFNDVIVNRILFVMPLLQFIPLFFAGTLFYKMHREKSKLLENYSLLLLCLVCQIVLYNYSGRSRGFVTQLEYAGMLTFYFCLFALFINGKLTFIVNKVTLFLGKISFALYLVHEYLSHSLLIPILVDQYAINFWIASLCITLPIVIGLATLITYYFEIPLSKKMKEKLHKTTFRINS